MGVIASIICLQIPCTGAGVRDKGDILFREREYPLWNPKRKAFRLAVSGLNDLDASGMEIPARGVAAFSSSIRFGLLLFSLSLCLRFVTLTQFPTTSDLYKLAIACQGGIAGARRNIRTIGRRRLGCTPTRSAERQRIIGAEASRIAAPMAASDAMLPRRLPIPQAVHLFKPQSRNVKTFLLGDLKGAVLFCEREQPPLPRSLLARRDNFALHWKSFSSSSLLISKLSTSTSAFALKCSGSSSLLHSALRFSALSGPIRPKS